MLKKLKRTNKEAQEIIQKANQDADEIVNKARDEGEKKKELTFKSNMIP